MIARVLVSLTVTALSKVAVPRLCMLSQVEAVAVTDEVSFTAEPAKIPNAFPSVVEKPSRVPRRGKRIAAITLKKKMIEIDCATSSSLAPITGAVAAIAEPPQIDEPTPISVAVLLCTLSTLCIRNATRRQIEIVHNMIGKDSSPVDATVLRLRPKPSKITAY